MLARRLHLSAAPALRRLSTKSSTGIVGMEVRPDAPEILLSVIETIFGGFYSGELGPSTIVGSAASRCEGRSKEKR